MTSRVYILFLLLAISGYHCSIDHGLGTLDTRITGDVVFLNRDQKPESVEAVRVIAVVNMPPESLGDVVFTYKSVNLSRDKSEYDIPAPDATYELVAAIWKEKGKAWNYGNILGFYGFDPVTYEIESKTVTIDKHHPVASNIDIICDWSLL
jgi:hypothetical protein